MSTPHHAALMRHLARKNRAWRRFMSRTIRLAAIADPRTGGNELLIHNWGNDAAKAVWRDGWRRWHAYSKRAEVISRDLMMRHIRHAA